MALIPSMTPHYSHEELGHLDMVAYRPSVLCATCLASYLLSATPCPQF